MKMSRVIYFAISTILLSILLLIQPKELVWKESFRSTGSEPFGSKLLYLGLKNMYGGRVSEVNGYAKENVDSVRTGGTVYMVIARDFKADTADVRALCRFAEKGNTVFIAAHSFGALMDSLPFKINDMFETGNTETMLEYHRAHNEPLRLIHLSGNHLTRFSFPDKGSFKILGGQSGSPDYISFSIGRGRMLFHSIPTAFTNYTIVDAASRNYAWEALSYLPKEARILWDTKQKPIINDEASPLSFFLSQPSLRVAIYLMTGAIVLSILFMARRKQRVIPVIKPEKNSTLDFIKVLGDLYYDQQDHKNMAEKKLLYFTEHLWSRYNMRLEEQTPEKAEIFAKRTGISENQARELLFCVNHFKNKPQIDEGALNEINNQIETFYQKSRIHGRTVN